MSPALAHWLTVIAVVVAFALGSLPFGVWLNRVVRGGMLTLLLDAAKGALAGFMMSGVGRDLWFSLVGWGAAQADAMPVVSPWICGLFVVLGHCFSPWRRFRGGKGVATAFGVVCVLSPWAALAGLLAFVAAFGFRQIGSLASLFGLLAAMVVELMLRPPFSELFLFAAMVFIVLLRHEKNINALLESQESPFTHGRARPDLASDNELCLDS